MDGPQPAYLEGATPTQTAASRTAAMWLSNPLNKHSLPMAAKAADTDGDGMVDKDEFKALFEGNAQADKLFAMIDKDGDGNLTEDELKQLAHAQQNKFKARNA